MCNLLRYKDKMDLARVTFEEISDIRITPKFNFKVAPSEPAPVLSVQDGQARISMMNFGFESHKGRYLMARGETVTKLPTFKEGFRSRRCLVLVHGFYDSEDFGRWKQPWHIHLKNDELMGFAGLWESRKNAENFTIISSPANAVVSRVIDRMPVILPQPLWRPWMDSKMGLDELQAMLKPFPAELMEAYPVTREVNKRGFNAPQCIEPVVPDQADLGLFG